MATFKNIPDGVVGFIRRSENTVSFNITSEADRIKKFEWRKSMLDDFYYPQVEEELGNIIVSAEETGLIDQIDDTNNIYRMVIEEISKVYDKEPERTFSTIESIQASLESLYEEIGVTTILEQSNLYMNAFNDVLLQVGYENENLTLRLRRPDNTIVKTDDDLNLEEVYIYKEHTATKQQIWYGYTKDSIFKIEVSDPNAVLKHNIEDRLPITDNDDMTNPIGVLPFIPIQNGFRDSEFWQMYKGDDLVKGNIQIAIKLTMLNQLIKFQSFKQIVATADSGSGKALEGVKIDPASVIYLFGENSKLETLDLESNYKQLWDTIKEIYTNIATNYKISPNLFRMTSAPTSGFSLQMENLKLDKFIKKQQKYYIGIEKKLYAMLQYFNDKLELGYVMPDEFSVKFESAHYPLTEIEELTIQEKEIALGKISPAELIADEKNITIEEARKLYQSNLKDRNLANEKLNPTPTVNLPTGGGT